MKRFMGFGLVLSLTALTAFFAACSNPSGPSGGINGGTEVNIPTPTPPNDGFTPVLPGDPNATVSEQLNYLWLNAAQGGTYVVWARANETLAPGYDIGNINGNNFTVRIRSFGPNTPPPRRVLTLGSAGTMLNVQGNNTLILYDIELAGLSGNTQPLVTVAADGTLNMENGAVIRDNGGFGVHLLGSASELNMTRSQIRDNARRGVVVNSGGTITMGEGARVEGNQGGGVVLMGSSLYMEGNAIIYDNYSCWIANSGLGFGSDWPHQSGGGVSANMSGSVRSSVTMSGTSRIENNRSPAGGDTIGGGGVMLSNSDLIMNDSSRIIGNQALSHNGGGVHLRGTQASTVRMKDDSRVENNIAAVAGGGLDTRQASGRIYLQDRAAVTGNKSFIAGSAMQISPGTYLFMLDNGVRVHGNTHTTGVGNAQIRLSENSRFDMAGGIITAPLGGVALSPHADSSARYVYRVDVGNFGAPANGYISPAGNAANITAIEVIDGHLQP